MTKRPAKIMAVLAAAMTISAGTMSVSANVLETASDPQYLNDMGLCPDRWGNDYTLFHWGKVSRTVDGSWA